MGNQVSRNIGDRDPRDILNVVVVQSGVRASKHMTVKVKPGSDIIHLLDATAAGPVELEWEGVAYRLSRADEAEGLWSGYDPERVRAGLRAMAGIITPDEAERMKALVYRGRQEGTRPADRP